LLVVIVLQKGDKPPPLTAQVAYQQGTAIARNLKSDLEGKEPQPVHLVGNALKLGLGESCQPCRPF